jgi:hypothetical protein
MHKSLKRDVSYLKLIVKFMALDSRIKIMKSILQVENRELT